MSLGLPEFGSRGTPARAGRWEALRLAGLMALAYAAAISAFEWRSESLAASSLDRAREQMAATRSRAEDEKRSLQKNADLLVATTSVESSPERVLADLQQVLPEGVFLAAVKIDYPPGTPARLDFSVVARSPEVYDRFLSSLSKSPLFGEIKPGSESRPGLVRATVTAIHRAAARAQ